MPLVARGREELRRQPRAGTPGATGLDKLREPRSTIPAVTHVDYSARIQTVDAARHPLLHNLLDCFHAQTGCPVLVNTSFNVRGEPIVCSPVDAYRCFMATQIDALAIGRYILLKRQQADQASVARREAHLAAFQLD
jgi:carbamoyltransferase